MFIGTSELRNSSKNAQKSRVSKIDIQKYKSLKF